MTDIGLGDSNSRPGERPSSATAQGSPVGAADDRRAWEACVGFEGVLIAQMMRTMRGKPSNEGVLPIGSGEEAFAAQQAEAVAQEAAEGSPLGIARMLYAELKRGG